MTALTPVEGVTGMSTLIRRTVWEAEQIVSDSEWTVRELRAVEAELCSARAAVEEAVHMVQYELSVLFDEIAPVQP